MTWIEGAAHTVPIQAARGGVRALQQGWGGPVPSEQSRRVGLGSPPLLTFAVTLVLGELKARAALAGDAPLGGLSADVGAAVVLVHAVHSF